MRGLRTVLSIALCAVIGLFCVQGAGAEERKAYAACVHGNISAGSRVVSPMEGRDRPWWGVLYQGALWMARADENAEDEDAALSETEEVEFVWPVWNWLLSLLGLNG